MRKSKRQRKFDAATEARRRARKVIGIVPVARVIPDKRKKALKHKEDYINQTDA
jgi:hypothetical protein